MSPWWHCRACGRLFRIPGETVRVSCVDCGRGPIVLAKPLHARLAEECNVSDVIVYSSKKDRA